MVQPCDHFLWSSINKLACKKSKSESSGDKNFWLWETGFFFAVLGIASVTPD